MYKLASLLCITGIAISGSLHAQGIDSIPVVRGNQDRVIIVKDNDAKPTISPRAVDVEVSIPNDLSGGYDEPELSPLLAADTGELRQRHVAAATEKDGASDQRFWELYHQMQLLADEVRQLRGAVEVSENLVRQLDKRQMQNYVDLDERLTRFESPQKQSLSSASPQKSAQPIAVTEAGGQIKDHMAPRNIENSTVNASATQAVLQTMAMPEPEVITDPSMLDVDEQSDDQAEEIDPSASDAAASASLEIEGSTDERLLEKADYDRVYALLEQRDFESARIGFKSFVSDYPKGQLRGNALYWLAELSLRQKTPDEDMALNYINQLISEYPDHARIPDALYKQATLSYRRNEVEAASNIFSQIVKEHPNTTAARLADHQLRRIGGDIN